MNNLGLLACLLSVQIKARNTVAVEEIISFIAASYTDKEALKQIFTPVLDSFNCEDREWLEQLRLSATWVL